jgi:DnaB-like helicase C terminal domain
MGMIHHTQQPTTPFQAVLSGFDTATRMLAASALNQPYSFFQISGQLHPQMLESAGHGEQWGKVLAECKAQHEKYGQYTPRSVGTALSRDLSAFALDGADMELRFAFDLFFEQWGKVTEVKIHDSYYGWFSEGLSTEEIVARGHEIRREAGLFREGMDSDGEAEFEHEMFESFDGRIQQPTVTPPIASLRRLIRGYKPGDYIVVAALSGVGKSFYALNHIAHLSFADVPCAYVNLENIPKDVRQILFQMWTGREYSLEENARLPIDEMGAMKDKWEAMKKMPFRSVNPGRSLPAILSFIRQERQERGIQFAVVDYAQLISIPGYKGPRNYELAEVSAALRCLALELNIPIMVMAQMKQEVWLRPDKRGSMYDIRDCANFAQDATHVQLLYRPSYFKIENDENGQPYPPGYADVHNAKGRSTGTAIAACSFSHVKGFYDDDGFNEPTPAFTPAMPASFTRHEPTEDDPF